MVTSYGRGISTVKRGPVGGRSARAIVQARTGGAPEHGAALEFRQAAAESFSLEPGETPYDLAFALRVGPSTAGTRKRAARLSPASPPP
jgi:hypothetical protein